MSTGTDLGGSLAFRRARLGGVRVELTVPLPIVSRGSSLISGLVGAPPPREEPS